MPFNLSAISEFLIFSLLLSVQLLQAFCALDCKTIKFRLHVLQKLLHQSAADDRGDRGTVMQPVAPRVQDDLSVSVRPLRFLFCPLFVAQTATGCNRGAVKHQTCHAADPAHTPAPLIPDKTRHTRL